MGSSGGGLCLGLLIKGALALPAEHRTRAIALSLLTSLDRVLRKGQRSQPLSLLPSACCSCSFVASSIAPLVPSLPSPRRRVGRREPAVRLVGSIRPLLERITLCCGLNVSDSGLFVCRLTASLRSAISARRLWAKERHLFWRSSCSCCRQRRLCRWHSRYAQRPIAARAVARTG